METTKFIILGAPRCGTNLLLDRLRCHPNIKVYGELFNLFNLSRADLKEVLNNPVEYLKARIYKRHFSNIKAIGFKLLYYHVEKRNITSSRSNIFNKSCIEVKNKIIKYRSYLKQNGFNLNLIGKKIEIFMNYLISDKKISIIHLKRRNILKAYLSAVRAAMTNEWIKTDNRRQSNLSPIKLDFNETIKYFKQNSKFKKKYGYLFKDHNKIDVYYEDLVNTPVPTMNSIFRFLSLSPINTSTHLRKQNKLPLAKAIYNYEELKDKFKNTKWAKFFE